MKILLSIIICSSVAGECMPPISYKKLFPTEYDCLHFGYAESQRRLEAIGKHDVNKFRLEFNLLTITYPLYLFPLQRVGYLQIQP